MLSNNSIALAKTVVKQTNVSLEAGSNLFADSIRYSLPLMVRKGISLEDAGAEVQSAADVVIESEGISQHEGAMGNAVEILLTGITNQFDYIRGTVRPFISVCTDRLLNRLKTSSPAEYNISEFEIHEFLTSEVSDRIFKDIPLSTYYKVAKGGTEKDAPTIMQEIATNIPEIDDALGYFVGKFGQTALLDIYNAVFRDLRPDDKTELTDLTRRLVVRGEKGLQLGVYSLDEVEFLTLAYFIADGYLDNPVDGTGLSLDEYQTYIKQTMNNIGSSIRRLVNQYNADVKNSILYLRRPTAHGIFFDESMGRILVLKPVFRQAMEQGLVVEQIIGGAINPNRKIYRLTELLPIKEEALAHYRAVDKQRQLRTSLTMIDRINDCMRIILNESLEELPDDKFPADFNRQAAIGNISKVTDVLKVYFAKWDSSEEIQIHDVMTRIICEIVFPFTDAYSILETMETIAIEEEIEPRYAAYYAEVLYMARWMVGNFHIAADEV